MTDNERFERGKKVREAVLGSAHVARTANNRTPFNAEFQDFLMEYAWGSIWSRPGLDHKTRSMITIAMLVAMGRLDELKLHIRATLNTGVSRDEVKEIMMHAAIYAGVPAAFGAFQLAAQIFRGHGQGSGGGMIKIWGRSTSLNVQKALWCCVELGIAFERIDWAGPFGGNDDPAYLAKNPNGRVPTIEDGDKIIWESNTILRYLCATYGGAHLHPAEPYRRSEVERWMDWQLASLNPPMTTMLLGYYRAPADKRDATALEAARKEALRCWTIVEKFIAGRKFLAGTDLTLADIGNGILAHRWHNYPIERPALPNIKAWYQTLSERPGFRAHILGPIA